MIHTYVNVSDRKISVVVAARSEEDCMDDVLALITAADCWPQSWQQPNRKFLAQSQQIFTSLIEHKKEYVCCKEPFSTISPGGYKGLLP